MTKRTYDASHTWWKWICRSSSSVMLLLLLLLGGWNHGVEAQACTTEDSPLTCWEEDRSFYGYCTQAGDCRECSFCHEYMLGMRMVEDGQENYAPVVASNSTNNHSSCPRPCNCTTHTDCASGDGYCSNQGRITIDIEVVDINNNNTNSNSTHNNDTEVVPLAFNVCTSTCADCSSETTFDRGPCPDWCYCNPVTQSICTTEETCLNFPNYNQNDGHGECTTYSAEDRCRETHAYLDWLPQGNVRGSVSMITFGYCQEDDAAELRYQAYYVLGKKSSHMTSETLAAVGEPCTVQVYEFPTGFPRKVTEISCYSMESSVPDCESEDVTFGILVRHASSGYKDWVYLDAPSMPYVFTVDNDSDSCALHDFNTFIVVVTIVGFLFVAVCCFVCLQDAHSNSLDRAGRRRRRRTSSDDTDGTADVAPVHDSGVTAGGDGTRVDGHKDEIPAKTQHATEDSTAVYNFLSVPM